MMPSEKGENYEKKNPASAASQTDHRKELVQLIRQLSGKYGSWKVFEDFLAMSALSFSNTVDWTHREERESQYMDIVNQYEKSELELFPEMLAHLTLELEENLDHPKDILGVIFHELELHNKYTGQFFTPQEICDFMGAVSIGEHDKIIEEKGFISVCEPCAGSGAMVLGFANAMKDCKYHYQKQMVVTATDVDLKCVYMTYLQLSLYGIPAVVIHGNSLTLEEWSRWYTPVYLLDGWIWRKTCGNLHKRYPEDEAIKRALEPMYAVIQDAEELMTEAVPPEETVPETPEFNFNLQECRNGQLSLL